MCKDRGRTHENPMYFLLTFFYLLTLISKRYFIHITGKFGKFLNVSTNNFSCRESATWHIRVQSFTQITQLNKNKPPIGKFLMKRRVLKSELLSTLRPSLTNCIPYSCSNNVSEGIKAQRWKALPSWTLYSSRVNTHKKTNRIKTYSYIMAIGVMVYNGDKHYKDTNRSEGVWWAAEGITGHHSKFSWEVENEQRWKKEEAMWFSGQESVR